MEKTYLSEGVIMSSSFPKKTVLSLFLAATALSLNAATPLDLKSGDMPVLAKHFNIEDQHSLNVNRSFDILSKRVDFNGVLHTRLQQMHQGVPVFGGYVITHRDKSHRLQQAQKVSGRVFIDLNTDLGKKPKHITGFATKALESQQQNYKEYRLSQPKTELMIFVDDNNKAHWAYKVSFLALKKSKLPKRPTAIIDAKTFKPFVSWDNIKTARTEAKGVGFGGNLRTGKYEFGKDFPTLDITRDSMKSMCYMENNDVKVVNMGSDYYSNNEPMSFACADEQFISANMYRTGPNGDGYDEANGAFSPSNDALYAGYVIKHMYRDWYDLPVLVNRDGSLMQLVMRVHYGNEYENAYWDGSQMTYGDGGSWMYPLVSLGVGAHEVSHGFTEQNSDLQYFGQSGGINESFSDMAAQAAEYYSEGENHWMIGERIMKPESGYDALRYMDRPSKDGQSIDTAEEYYSGLDVHYSSGVYNHLFYLIANQPGWNTKKAFDVMVKANQDYWTPYVSFNKAACGVLSATNDYAQKDASYELASVKLSLDKVAIDYSQCTL